MDPIEYLRGVRRRWRLILVVLLAACAVGGVGSAFIASKQPESSFEATTTLYTSGSTSGGTTTTNTRTTSKAPGSVTTDLNVTASLVTIENVAMRVAKDLKFTGPPSKLSRNIRASVNKDTGFLEITAHAKNSARAKELADLFAKALMGYVTDLAQQKNSAEEASLNQQIVRLKGQIAKLDKQIKKYPPVEQAVGGRNTSRSTTVSPADPYIEQRDASLGQLRTLATQLEQVRSRKADAGGLTVVQSATAKKLKDSGISSIVKFPMGLIIAGVLGLLGGIALALLRERFDVRIRTKAGAEEHFGFAVLAEIPFVKRRRSRRRGLITKVSARAADSFRVLAAAVAATSRPADNRSANGNGGSHERRSTVVLVSSAGPDEGTTTVVAELAATFAQQGKAALILGCDFRRPDIHERFNVPNAFGLADVLGPRNGASILDSCVWYTDVSGVYLAPSGSAKGRPNDLLAAPELLRAVDEARHRADVVLLDTTPIMTSDVTFLLPSVDAVLVVARSGKTSPDLATRSGGLLRQLSAPVIGIVLNGAGEVGLPRRYYRRDENWKVTGRRLSRATVRTSWSVLRAVVMAVRHPSRIGKIAVRGWQATMKVPAPLVRRVRNRRRKPPPWAGTGGSTELQTDLKTDSMNPVVPAPVSAGAGPHGEVPHRTIDLDTSDSPIPERPEAAPVAAGTALEPGIVPNGRTDGDERTVAG